MKRREMLSALPAIAALGTFPAMAAVKHPFQVCIRPLDNGYLLNLVDTSYSATGPAITAQEIFVADSNQAGATIKAWLDLIKAIA